MQYDIITIFPDILDSYFNESILKRAQKAKLIKIKTHDLRKQATGRHKQIDDSPYGGGPGMVMMIEPLYKTLKTIRRKKKSKVFLMDPAGQQFNQKLAQNFANDLQQLILICGRYEGVDARIDKLIDGKISIGPYVLSGGELPAAIIVEATARLIPGVLGKFESTEYETFSGENSEIIEHPQYTRPEKFKSWPVPEILLSGDHKKIKQWRENTKKN